MKKLATRIAMLFALAGAISVTAKAQAPTIASDGVRNGASYTIAGLPNSGIAQGSIFVIFGDNMGPTSIVQVSAFPLPTTAGLAGTSVRVSVGGVTQNAIMLYTLKTQVAAVLPSNTPVGTGTVQVTYNGQTSNAAPITVLAGGWGTFTRNQGGTGPSIIQNFNTEASQPFNTLLDSARPGQTVILWGTGLGPVQPGQVPQEAAQALPGNRTDINARVFVGGREAAVDYRGRSGCCVGIDQIVFRVPAGVTGCHVPVSVQVGNVASNFTSMSIADNGGACSDPGGFTAADLERARANGGLRVGSVSLAKSQTRLNIPGVGNFDSKSNSGSASFIRISLDNILNQDNSGASPANPGACSVTVQRLGSGQPSGQVNFVGLNAGPNIGLSGPNGAQTLDPTPNFVGLYGKLLSQSGFGTSQPDYIVPGAYTFTGPGGPDVGGFTANLTVPSGTTWANEASVTTVVRANGQLITWTGGDPNSFTYIVGGTSNANNTAFGQFVCFERTSAGQFTIPSAVLLALPASGSNQTGVPTGTLAVGTYSTPGTFTAPGLDFGATIFISTVGKGVTYQ